jgi:DNA ligase (NAD+)
MRRLILPLFVGIRSRSSQPTALLATHFGSLEAIREAGMETLRAIPDIGPVLAANIAAFFRQDHNLEIIHRLRQAGVHWQELEAVNLLVKPLAGLTFVITGTLQSMTREQAKERLLALGAKVSTSVSKSTSFVVVGAEPGSKADQARELGIPLVDEQGLLEKVQAHPYPP